MHCTVICEHSFEAAHFLPHVPEGHPCKRVHGHSYRTELHVTGPIDPKLGWVVDFAVVDEAVAPLLQQLDHHLLNDIQGLDNPTIERVASWLFAQLQGPLPLLSAVVVHEGHRARCMVRARDMAADTPKAHG